MQGSIDCETDPLAESHFGATCSGDGAFVGNIPLLRRLSDAHGGSVWATRPLEDLSRDLSFGYCWTVDAQHLMDQLSVLAGVLNKRDLGTARNIAADLPLPPLPVRRDGRLDRGAQSRLARLLAPVQHRKADGEKPVNDPEFETLHPRHPKGSAGGVGGQFAPKPNEGPTSLSVTPKQLLSGTPRRTIKQIVSKAKRLGWKALFPGGITLDVLQLLLDPNPLNVGEEEALAHLRAEHDFAGGKTLEEIRAHPGGPGYQEHHFIEDTAENQSLPKEVREAPENKGKIPTFSHEELHANLSAKSKNAGEKTLRDTLRGKPPDEQLKAMFKLMRKLGILK